MSIEELGDWRTEMLRRVRDLIQRAEPRGVETAKWRKPSNPTGVPVWELDGIVCTGETYKDKFCVHGPRPSAASSNQDKTGAAGDLES